MGAGAGVRSRVPLWGAGGVGSTCMDSWGLRGPEDSLRGRSNLAVSQAPSTAVMHSSRPCNRSKGLLSRNFLANRGASG